MGDTAIDRAPRLIGVWVATMLLLAVLLVASDFVVHALSLGWQGLSRDLSSESRLYWTDAPVATTAIFAHMIAGAIITALAPLQLIGPLRRRAPAIHRWSGRTLAVAAVATGVAGLVYIAGRGTIGGAPMSLAFALYGIALIIAAGQAVRFARARQFDRHRRWALRLAVLALGSWLYRMQYGVWFLATGGVGVEDDFTGTFDLVNIWAFYLPWLAVLEVWFRREARRKSPAPA